MPSEPCFLRFWGVRGSIPTPGSSTLYYGGNTSCLEVRADGEIIVLDAGTGIRNLGLHLEQEFAARPEPLRITLLLSHTHWDHIQGFPFFVPAYKPENHITVLGFNETAKGIKAVLAGQMESPYFPISLSDMAGSLEIRELEETEFSLGKVRVTAYPGCHPGGAMGYRIATSSGTFVYLPDNEIDAGGAGATLSMGRQRLVEFLRGADVLVIDAQYWREEYEQHLGWGHGCVDEVVAVAIAAGVKRLELFHHDPDHNDGTITAMVEHARTLAAQRTSPLVVEAAREGVTIALPLR